MNLEYITDLEYDIYKSFLLNHYIKYWGVPKYSVKSIKDGEYPIFVYCFTRPYKRKKVNYFSTIGVGLQKKDDLSFQYQEYFLVLPEMDSIEFKDDVFNYILDISIHRVRNSKKNSPPVIMRSKLAPKEWLQKSILIDEPRGEPEDFSEILGLEKEKVGIFWLIPIYDKEHSLISSQGIEAFDSIEQDSEYDLIDIRRPSYIS